MSYDETMAQKFPAVMSIREDVNSNRPEFGLARRSQVAREWHSDPSVKSQVDAFVDAKRRQHDNTPSRASNSVYAPLVLSTETRVFELLPAVSGQPIRGNLHHVLVDFSVEHGGRMTDFAVSVSEAAMVCYTALSYTWGSKNDRKMTGKIEIDKKSIDITTRLDQAIRRLRHEKDSIMIWADQICIDQKNLAEREAQVRLMSLIYSRALNTVIWLGDTSAQDAFNASYDLENATPFHSAPLVGNEQKRIRKLDSHVVMEQLFDDPWFQRTWTTQEACMSNEPWLVAETSVCHWEDCFGMAAVNDRLGLFDPTSAGSSSTSSGSSPASAGSSPTQGPSSPTPTGHNTSPIRLHGFHCAAAIWEIKKASRSDRSLLDALVKTRHTQATVPHDKVYGILGLFENDISPNYSMKVIELWWNISLKILSTGIETSERKLQNRTEPYHAFSFLSCIDHPVDGSGDLPSWAVDWSKPRVTTSLAYNPRVKSCFNAGQQPMASRGLTIDQIGKVLSLKAKLFDNIAHLSPILENADLEAAVSAAKNNTALRICIAHAKLVPTRQQLEFMSFCKVVTAGKDCSGWRKYPDRYNEILSFLSDALTGERPTFHLQPYTRRQEVTGQHQLTVDNLKTRDMGERFQEVKEAFKSALLNRRLCWTKRWHLGLVPRFAEQDDQIVVVPGSPVPFVVRPAGKDSYHFIGECYIDGIMDGEAFKMQGKWIEEFDLV